MGQEPEGVCGYTWPEDHEEDDDPFHQSCCYRSTLEDTDRCAWHADPSDTDEKTIESLRDIRVDPEIRQQTSPVGELFDGAILTDLELNDKISLSRVSLRDSECTGVNLDNADLTGVHFTSANLTDSYFFKSNLTDSLLVNANMTDANFGSADLTDANLAGADMKDKILINADLINAVLWYTNLISTNLRNADLSGINFQGSTTKSVEVNASTTCGRQTQAEKQASDAKHWDDIARGYHSLKTMFSEAGLVGKARKHHYLERRARGFEAKASTDLNPWITPNWLGSIASRYLIGYGIRVRILAIWMAILFIGSTLVYINFGVEETVMANISYSVRAFTVAPPRAPVEQIPHIVMMIETFFGTLSIVLLGYVLGNREQF